jgi:hypothetical protein
MGQPLLIVTRSDKLYLQGFSLPGLIKILIKYFNQIIDLDLICKAFGTEGVIKHNQTIGAGCGDCVSIDIQGVLESLVINSGIRVSFQPHCSTAASTAKTLFFGRLHFQWSKICALEQFPWLRIDVIVPSQITGVVKSEPAEILSIV